MQIGRGWICAFAFVLCVFYKQVAANTCEVTSGTSSSSQTATGTLCLATQNKDGTAWNYASVDATVTTCTDVATNSAVFCNGDDLTKYFCCTATTTACNKPSGSPPTTDLKDCTQSCYAGDVGSTPVSKADTTFKSCIATTIDGTKVSLAGSPNKCEGDPTKDQPNFCVGGVTKYKCCTGTKDCIASTITATDVDQTCPDTTISATNTTVASNDTTTSSSNDTTAAPEETTTTKGTLTMHTFAALTVLVTLAGLLVQS